MNFVDYAAITLVIILVSCMYYLTRGSFSAGAESDVYINCVNSDGSIAWSGDAKHVEYYKGKWSFHDAVNGDKISTNADCTIKNSSK